MRISNACPRALQAYVASDEMRLQRSGPKLKPRGPTAVKREREREREGGRKRRLEDCKRKSTAKKMLQGSYSKKELLDTSPLKKGNAGWAREKGALEMRIGRAF